MPKINVYLPDDLAESVKDSGVPVSAICQRALEQAVRRVTAIRSTALGDLEGDDPLTRLAHLTERARTAIRLAVRRAGEQGTAGVGTEHLLGGVLAEGGNLALHVLRALDIDPATVEGELARVPAETATAAGGGRRFTGHAANALELTTTEAIALGHNYIGCEHLLLGLVTEPEGAGGRVLRGLGAEPRLTRRAVTAALAGYVHLRAQGAAAGGSAGAAEAVTAAVRAELRPLVARIERLERRAGLAAEN